MRASEFLIEYETRNLLYHGVPSGKIVSQILKSGFIEPQPAFDGDEEQEQDGGEESIDRISLTRNQFLHFPYGGAVAQFVIDRDALKKHNYKIKPVVGFMTRHKGETEEQVFKPIPIRSPFVVGLQYDPNIQVPKSVLKKLKELGVAPMPWKQSKQNVDGDTVIKKTKTKYNPKRIVVQGNDYTANGEYHAANSWYVGYKPVSEPGTYLLTQPSKDEQFVNDLAEKIKQRMANQQSWEDLLPQTKYGKNWRQGKFELQHGTSEYDKS